MSSLTWLHLIGELPLGTQVGIRKEKQDMFDDFPKAIAEPRGCGEREEGGVYAECGPSPSGSPLEHFLFDPPLPLPDGVDLINKPQLWQRADPVSGEPVLDLETDAPVYDLLIWIGAEH